MTKITNTNTESNSFIEFEQTYNTDIFNKLAIEVFVSDVNRRFLNVNNTFCHILGYTRDEILKMTFKDITHPDDLDEDIKHLNLLLGGYINSYRIEKRYNDAAQNIVWIDLSV